MKLRNKKTGVLTEIEETNLVIWNAERDCYESFEEYHSLAELNEEWEDYNPAEPKEPLIKDEKIRKAIRAWADANGIERVWHEYSSHWLRGNGLVIAMENEVTELGQGNYTIDELCGEEE